MLAIAAVRMPLAASSSLLSLAAVGQIVSHPTLDAAFIFGLLAAALFSAFAAGRRKIVSAIMVFYMAIAIFAALPAERVISSLGLRNAWWGPAALFLVLFLLLVLFLGARRAGGFASGAWTQTLFLSIALMGLVGHSALSLLPANKTALFGPWIRRIFLDPSVHIWWLILPVVLLIIIRRLAMRDE